MKNLRAVLISSTISVGVIAQSAASEITIGRWCDTLFPGMVGILELNIGDGGAIFLSRAFSDGSGSTNQMEELGNDVYAEPDSAWGEKYRIVPSTGELQLIDDDGLIRTARRLENQSYDGECR